MCAVSGQVKPAHVSPSSAPGLRGNRELFRGEGPGRTSPSSARVVASPTRPLIRPPAARCQVGQPCPGPLGFLLFLHPLQVPTSPSSLLWAGGPGALPSVHLSPPLLGELPCPCLHRAACPWPALRLLGCSSCPGFPGLPCVPSPPRPVWCFSASLPSTVQACLQGTLNSAHIVPSSLRPVWTPSSSKPSWAWRSWVGWPYSGDEHPGQQTLGLSSPLTSAEAYRRVQERDRGVHPLPVILAGCSPSSCLTVQGPLWSPPAQGATSPGSRAPP